MCLKVHFPLVFLVFATRKSQGRKTRKTKLEI